MEREKLESEDVMIEKSSAERCEDENAELRRQLHTLQEQLCQLENEHVHRSISPRPEHELSCTNTTHSSPVALLAIGSPSNAGGPGAEHSKEGPKWPELCIKTVSVMY